MYIFAWNGEDGIGIKPQAAKQLLPLAEEYEMFKLRRNCENVLHAAYEQLRKDHRLGHIPPEINEEYLIMSDRYRFDRLLNMCIDEHVHCAAPGQTKTIVNADTLSESVKLIILEKKLARLNNALDRERKYKHDMESTLSNISPRTKWSNKFVLY
ncbi:hypothetical protein MAR_015441 [Mya arenaria]|uniref:Uncharacterized protein n=1 Tax=Mya arenaria TaxID=6604 RepID=A0ABY7FIS3_MYAAR|nr:hypothetical protein MAR_015441 [Mya arenaria]